MSFLTDIFTGGLGSIGTKIVAGVVAASLLFGGVMYVQKLRSDNEVLRANEAVLQGALDAEHLRVAQMKLDLKSQQIIADATNLKFRDLDAVLKSFNRKVEETTKAQVDEVKKSGGDPKVLEAVTSAVNRNLATSRKCVEIAASGPDASDRADPEIARVCPEVLK